MSADVKLHDAYETCRLLTAEFSKTFYAGSLLFSAEKRRAIWAIYAWCRRTDELVDGLGAEQVDPGALDDWQERLDAIFAGRVDNSFDLALADTVQNFPFEPQPFRDMIEGMRMDLRQNRYQTFEELHTYCYRVAGTVGLMFCAVSGFEQEQPQTREQAIALGVAKQLTNILRDVGEDARRGRVYLPLEDLHKFDYTEEDLFASVVDERWIALMEFEIERTRQFYRLGEQGIPALAIDARWPAWASLIMYRRILDKIRQNGYQNFTRRAYVPKLEKFMLLLGARVRV